MSNSQKVKPSIGTLDMQHKIELIDFILQKEKDGHANQLRNAMSYGDLQPARPQTQQIQRNLSI